jgi:hypothetical protein
VLGAELEALVLAGWITAIGLEQHRDGSQTVAVAITELGAQLEQIRHPGAVLRFRRTHHRAARRPGTHFIQILRGADLALQDRAVERRLEIGCVRLMAPESVCAPVVPTAWTESRIRGTAAHDSNASTHLSQSGSSAGSGLDGSLAARGLS